MLTRTSRRHPGLAAFYIVIFTILMGICVAFAYQAGPSSDAIAMAALVGALAMSLAFALTYEEEGR